MRQGLARRSGLVKVPTRWLEAGFLIARQQDDFQRLTGSLVVDISALRRLNWVPKVSTYDALAVMARNYRYPVDASAPY